MLSTLSGGRGRDARQAAMLQMVPQPRTLYPLACTTAECLFCVAEGRTCLGLKRNSVLLTSICCTFSNAQSFPGKRLLWKSRKDWIWRWGEHSQELFTFQKDQIPDGNAACGRELPESHSCISLHSQLSDSRGLDGMGGGGGSAPGWEQLLLPTGS